MDLKRISFSNTYAYNICSNDYKKNIVEQIQRWVKAPFKRPLENYHPKKHFRHLVKSPQFVSTKSIGNSYFLFLTRHQDESGKNVCFYIDRKIVKGYDYPRIIFVHYRFAEPLFENTLIDGDLIKTGNGWKFLWNDIYCYKNQGVGHQPFLKRMAILKKILHTEYTCDPYWEPCPIKVKNYIAYGDRSKEDILSEIESKNYPVQGVVFTSSGRWRPPVLVHLGNFRKMENPNVSNHNCNSVEKLQKNRKKETLTSKTNKSQSQKTNKRAGKSATTPITKIVLAISPTSHHGVYQLFCQKTNKIVKHSIARIDGLQNLAFVRKLLEKRKNAKVECEYNTRFQKFVAVSAIDAKSPISEYRDILEFIKLKTKS